MDIISSHFEKKIHARRSWNRSSIPDSDYLLKIPYSPFKTNQISTLLVLNLLTRLCLTFKVVSVYNAGN